MSSLQASFRNSIVSLATSWNFWKYISYNVVERASWNAIQECPVSTISETSFLSGHIPVLTVQNCTYRSLLPNLAKHVVLTMLYNPDPVPFADFDSWFTNDSASKLYWYSLVLCSLKETCWGVQSPDSNAHYPRSQRDANAQRIISRAIQISSYWRVAYLFDIF